LATTEIFIVEDEPSIAQAVEFTLEAEGIATRRFATGGDCLKALGECQPSLILLDIGLADGSGFDFFRKFRQLTAAPIIFTTARGDEIDRVAGLEMGAEDYIVKPFSLREMVARIRVALRHADNNKAVTPTGKPSSFALGDFRIDNQRKQIRYCSEVLSLTLHEYRLLETLLRNPDRVLSRSQLLEQAWDAPDHRLERTIDTHIKSLRSKLREIAADKNPIITHRGLGYSLALKS